MENPIKIRTPIFGNTQKRRDVQLLSSYVLLQDMAFFRERAAGTTQYMLKLKVWIQGVN